MVLKKLVLPEGGDPRIVESAAEIEKRGIAHTIVFREAGAPSQGQIDAVMRQRPKMTETTARRLLQKPLYFGCAMVAAGEADACLAGAENPTARVIESALMTIGLKADISVPSSFFLMKWPDRHLIFADCAVNAQPTAAELAAIARASAQSARIVLGEEPRVALLSFSTKGSATHADVEKVQQALDLLKDADFAVDGEFQADSALSPQVASRKVKAASEVAGRANVLIFPDLDAGNIAYKIAQYLGGAKAIGPVLQGFNRPVSDLSRGATVEDIVSTAAMLLSLS
jgi:phosphate acetyltransferase